jgi:hypothetical protein
MCAAVLSYFLGADIESSSMMSCWAVLYSRCAVLDCGVSVDMRGICILLFPLCCLRRVWQRHGCWLRHM